MMSLLGVMIGLAGLALAYQPDQFHTLVAAHESQEVRNRADVDRLVSKIVGVADGGWFWERIAGSRIQLDEVRFFNHGLAGTFQVEPEAGKAGWIILPTAACPHDEPWVRIFVRDAGVDQFGTLDARNGLYVLDGLYDVGNVRSRVSSEGPYCYVDLKSVG